MQFINMLDSWWTWGAFAVVPPAVIVALYFLKLRREPLEVPSTYLWTRSIEDLRVNSLWQRMRQSLLLFLQLLLLAIVAFALLRPYWEGGTLQGDRFIFLIDNSASMTATDVAPSRLDEAKRRVGQMLDEMSSGTKAMIISFSDTAQVEQSFTDNVYELRRALEAIRPTNRSTSLDEALRLAAGLANPTTSREVATNQLAEPLPAKVYIMSDGRFPDVRGFSVGNLEPEFVPIGVPDMGNVGIVAFSTGRSDEHPDQLQAFARIENHGKEPVKVGTELYLNGQLIDARETKIAAGESASEAFDLGSIDRGVLRLAITTPDAFMADNQAWTVINPSRRAHVLLITAGDEPLERALTVPSAQQWAEVTKQLPVFLKTPDYAKQAASGVFDLIIYDRCRPEQLPQASTWFIGTLPPGPEWSGSDFVVRPQIIDTDRSHPIMQGIELGDVDVSEGRTIKAPPGGTKLIDSNKGTLMAIAPREGFEDAVLGVDFIGASENGEAVVNTNWPIKLSFPVFVSNVLQYFGRNQQASTAASVHPGQPIALKTESAATVAVKTPSGTIVDIPRNRQNTFNFAQTEQLGVYDVREGGKTTQQFAVNLFDPKESDIAARTEGSVKIGYVEVKAANRWQPARRELWKFLLIAALAVLLFEWYIYNRRVYL
ncbi:MAG TPA: BatA and WFA domain-containing protein [Pirellulales bacterium]|nr:BatA and WFA domain-containing protein [Pirellulales bacterium]